MGDGTGPSCACNLMFPCRASGHSEGFLAALMAFISGAKETKWTVPFKWFQYGVVLTVPYPLVDLFIYFLEVR